MGVIQLKTPIPGPKSRALAERRETAVPRGLSHATPMYVARAQDAWLEDVDGNRFIDFAGGVGATYLHRPLIDDFVDADFEVTFAAHRCIHRTRIGGRFRVCRDFGARVEDLGAKQIERLRGSG